jgi:hypothetical protein
VIDEISEHVSTRTPEGPGDRMPGPSSLPGTDLDRRKRFEIRTPWPSCDQRVAAVRLSASRVKPVNGSWLVTGSAEPAACWMSSRTPARGVP